MSDQQPAPEKPATVTEYSTRYRKPNAHRNKNETSSSIAKESDSVALDVSSPPNDPQTSQPGAVDSVRPGSSGLADLQMGDFAIPHPMRFIALTIQVNKRDDADGCSYWTGPVAKAGYANVRIYGATYLAHRLVCALWSGPESVLGKDVHHLCERTTCVNPEHLVPVTRSEHRLIHAGAVAPLVVRAKVIASARQVLDAAANKGHKQPRKRAVGREVVA